MKPFYGLILYVFLLFFSSCGNKDINPDSVLSVENKVNVATSHDDASSGNVGRAIWQKPELVIQKLGDVSDKTIADIGAGTGYFSLKIASVAKKVIAIDINQSYLSYIDSLKTKLSDKHRLALETRLALSDNPKLKDNEIDMVLIINTIAYIEDLPLYLKNLRTKIKKEGKLMIIDYKMKKLPINAPPKSERIYLDKLEDILIENGYEILESDDTSLDYQFIIQATVNQ